MTWVLRWRQLKSPRDACRGGVGGGSDRGDGEVGGGHGGGATVVPRLVKSHTNHTESTDDELSGADTARGARLEDHNERLGPFLAIGRDTPYGRGASGTVHRGTGRAGRPVAIKIMMEGPTWIDEFSRTFCHRSTAAHPPKHTHPPHTRLRPRGRSGAE